MTSFSTDEYRRARPTIPDGSSTRQARTINANFRRELTHFILGGGLCDLTDRSQLPNNCLQGLSPQLQSMALGEDDPAGPPPPTSGGRPPQLPYPRPPHYGCHLLPLPFPAGHTLPLSATSWRGASSHRRFPGAS
jgi:hypothetical protein